MAWAVCQHSKGDIDWAGECLITLAPGDPKRDEALEIINNWRSCHSYPLHVVTKTLHDRAAGGGRTNTLVARRIKRLASIALKLRHNPAMKLSQMQDIGGCRAVLRNAAEIEHVCAVYEMAAVKHKNRSDRSFLLKVYNYLASPKPDGYRGIHVIMRYQSTTASKKAYNGQRIEIQIRSKLQHAWATAVETCQAFTGQALKSKIKTASDEWLRFFSLMSSAIAAREKRPLVPGTPSDKNARKAAIQGIESQMQIIAMLDGWNMAMQHTSLTDDPESAAFLLELDTNEKSLMIRSYRYEELPKAHENYLAREKATENDSSIQVVLVSADSLANLKRAYPNFYVDTTAFIKAVQQEIY